MSVAVEIVQFNGPGAKPVSADEAAIGVTYVLFDDSVPVTEEVTLPIVSGLTFANRGSWKKVMVQAIIADAADRGHTVLAKNIQWPTPVGGDFKTPTVVESEYTAGLLTKQIVWADDTKTTKLSESSYTYSENKKRLLSVQTTTYGVLGGDDEVKVTEFTEVVEDDGTKKKIEEISDG